MAPIRSASTLSKDAAKLNAAFALLACTRLPIRGLFLALDGARGAGGSDDERACQP